VRTKAIKDLAQLSDTDFLNVLGVKGHVLLSALYSLTTKGPKRTKVPQFNSAKAPKKRTHPCPLLIEGNK